MSEYVRLLREKVGHDLLFSPSVGCVVRDDNDRLLLVRHVEGWWTLPGGSIDPGETPAEAARRETREEASVEVELLRLVGVYGGYPDFHAFYGNGDEVAWVTTVFEGRVVDGAAAPGDDETAEVRWATLDDALAMEIAPSLRHILTCVREGRAFDP